MYNTNTRPAAAGMQGHPESLWLTNGHVVDVLNGTSTKNQNVELFDGRIKTITSNAPPAGATTLSGCVQ